MRRIGYHTLEKSGRLGNQLYEIASTLGFARAQGCDPVFPESWSYRPYFSVPDDWFDDRELRRSIDAPTLTDLPGIQRFYMQQWRFVAPVLDEVREIFTPSAEARILIGEHLLATDQTGLNFGKSTSLHVRRGDNMNPETHPVGTWPSATFDYYREAVERIGPGPVLVFSEDYDWCCRYLPDIVGQSAVDGAVVVKPGPIRPPDYFPAEYAAGDPTDFIDLQLQASCRAHIIANSTYSLWGAVLGGGPSVYPDNWVGFRCRDAVPDERTICPPDWTCLPNPVPTEWLVES